VELPRFTGQSAWLIAGITYYSRSKERSHAKLRLLRLIRQLPGSCRTKRA
jgi:hypothetical protein